MIRYSHCKVYEKKDKEKKAITFIDIDSETVFEKSVGFSSDIASEGDRMEASTISSFEFIPGNFNVIIPEYGDFKITGARKKKINVGAWKSKFRWWLTLEG